MGGRFGLVALATLALACTVASASRAVLTTASGSQYDLGTQEDALAIQRHLLADLKQAQEAAGIFVDDAHLFTQPASSRRRLQQNGLEVLALANPQVTAMLTTLLQQGLFPGGFPGAELALPGGTSLGYAPTDDSYCLFSTRPYAGPPAGAPTAAPPAFSCVAAGTSEPAPGSFPVDVNGATFICTGTAAAPPTGRRLQQAYSPAGAVFGNLLAAIGLPVWNCIVATTPAGNTTVGQATEAVLNDLGIVAEHVLFYLNQDGDLSYEENIKNNFVSLQNPLYPSGPRFNVSLDIPALTRNVPLLESIFRTPNPSPPPPPPTPIARAVASPPPAVPAAPGQPAPQTATSVTVGGTTVTTTDGGNAPSTVVVQAPGAAVAVSAPQQTKITAFDGYLDNCQTVVGTVPAADGNFDRNNNFTSVISDGVSNMTTQVANALAGQVTYVIPASKAVQYAPLTLANRKTAQFCYDIATLQPVYNPLATFITPNASGLAASPASTVAVFGQAYSLSTDALLQGLAIQLPAGQTLQTYDALGAATNGSGEGLAVLKKNVQLANLVSAGANLLTNDSATYASFAIIMNQAIAKKIVYSPPTGGRRLQQASAPAADATPAPAVNLANDTTVASIITIALQSTPALPDAATRDALNQGITAEQIAAVGAAVANLNSYVANAPGSTETQLAQFYAETQLVPAVSQLATGALSIADFQAATSTDAINENLAAAELPGQLIPTPVLSDTVTQTTTFNTASTADQGASSSSDGGLSHSGTVALATVLPIVGVIAIGAAVAYYISKKNRAAAGDSPNNSGVWWRRPFARGSASNSPIAGPSSSV